jgi:hypothetical protein
MKFKILVGIVVIIAGVFAVNFVLSKHAKKSAATKGASVQTSSNPVADLHQADDDLKAIVKNQDPLAALQELAKRMKADKVIFNNCHGLAHEIGHAAYRKYNDFNTALKYQDAVCSDGYLHGVIEQRFGDAPSLTAVTADMATVCNHTGVSAGRCYHGVGHGLMFYTDNNLPKALSFCTNYLKGGSGRCYEGVFMQNFLSDGILHPSKYIDTNNPLYPCPDESVGLRQFCYFYAPILYLNLHNNDYAAALAWCNTAVADGITSCIRGVGSLTMKYNIDQPKFVEGICGALSDRQISSCIDGMVSYYLTFYDRLSKAKEMCATLETAHQPACNAAITRRDGLFLN